MYLLPQIFKNKYFSLLQHIKEAAGPTPHKASYINNGNMLAALKDVFAPEKDYSAYLPFLPLFISMFPSSRNPSRDEVRLGVPDDDVVYQVINIANAIDLPLSVLKESFPLHPFLPSFLPSWHAFLPSPWA